MEQLDQELTTILLQSLLFCLGVFLCTFGIRRVVETAWAGVKKNKWWTEVFLPLGPIATGVILAFLAKSYAWPDIVKDPWSRAFFGGACGVASGWVYSRFRSILKAWATSPIKTEGAALPVDVSKVVDTLPDVPPTSLGGGLPQIAPDSDKTPLS